MLWRKDYRMPFGQTGLVAAAASLSPAGRGRDVVITVHRPVSPGLAAACALSTPIGQGASAHLRLNAGCARLDLHVHQRKEPAWHRIES